MAMQPEAFILQGIPSEANFAGPLVFELKVEEALESIKVIRAIRPPFLPAQAKRG